MAPTPHVTLVERTEMEHAILVPILAAGIPLFVGCALFLIAAISYRSRERSCIKILLCEKLGFITGMKASRESIRRPKTVVQSSPKLLKKAPNHLRCQPIDISTITRTLPTIPEVIESYSKMDFAFPTLTSTQISKKSYTALYKTPSDVPRTAELIESDSGPGKTVTPDYTRSNRYSYPSGFHIISGITPIKDSTICSTEVISYGLSPSLFSNVQSSAGVNICLLSPEVNFSKHSMFILPNGSRIIRNLSSTFAESTGFESASSKLTSSSSNGSHRINNTPEIDYHGNGIPEPMSNVHLSQTSSNTESGTENKIAHTLQYREFFIPGISFPTIPTIYPLLRQSEHWV